MARRGSATAQEAKAAFVDAEHDDTARVTIVPDVRKLLDEREARLHVDVIEVLVDLVVRLVDEEESHVESASG